jgi:hypothetical protein
VETYRVGIHFGRVVHRDVILEDCNYLPDHRLQNEPCS